jgi:hypothetical protein
MDAPRHLYLHSIESIELLGKNAGLELFDIQYDSVEFEFAASEQYLRDIALNAANSYTVDFQKSIFSSEQMEFFKHEAVRVNRDKIGGRAGFYFRHQKL